jgi:flagellar motor switch protein FliG
MILVAVYEGVGILLTKTYIANFESWPNAKRFIKRTTEVKLANDGWIIAKTIEPYELLDITKPKVFSIHDLANFDDRAFQKILREVDTQTLCKALKAENLEDLANKCFNNMSRRAVEMMKEDMEYMGPVLIEDITEAQEEILRVCQHLVDTGDIVFNI